MRHSACRRVDAAIMDMLIVPVVVVVVVFLQAFPAEFQDLCPRTDRRRDIRLPEGR